MTAVAGSKPHAATVATTNKRIGALNHPIV